LHPERYDEIIILAIIAMDWDISVAPPGHRWRLTRPVKPAVSHSTALFCSATHPLLFDGLWMEAEMLDAKASTAKTPLERLKSILTFDSLMIRSNKKFMEIL
jgi:hypothetical protein